MCKPNRNNYYVLFVWWFGKILLCCLAGLECNLPCYSPPASSAEVMGCKV